jgi:hypothetical protein
LGQTSTGATQGKIRKSSNDEKKEENEGETRDDFTTDGASKGGQFHNNISKKY